MSTPSKRNRREELEAWFGFLTRVLGFVFGLQLIAFDVIFMRSDPVDFRLAVLLTGVAFTGPVVAQSLGGLIRAARGESGT